MADHGLPRAVPADLLESLALEVWKELRSGSGLPARIDILKGRKAPGRRGAYRLAGAGPGGAPVIAKRCPLAKACVERTVYAEVFPHLPVAAPRYYGSVEEKGGTFCWLFLEDVGDERYSSANEEHRRLAGWWLGALHTSAARLAAAARLPDRGPGHYLERLRSGRARILANLANPALKAADLAVLEAIVTQYAALEARWHEVERFCEGLPRTVVHGDFADKNLRVRTCPGGTALLPFDWSNAGWGVPAIDLAQTPLTSARFAADPDPASYWTAVRDSWPAFDLRTIQRWGQLGTLFRLLAGVAWITPSLGQDWVEKAMRALRFYQTALDRELQAADWLGSRLQGGTCG
jgi:Ser/Thr protein kinase RdoA (MazF antagonist)